MLSSNVSNDPRSDGDEHALRAESEEEFAGEGDRLDVSYYESMLEAAAALAERLVLTIASEREQLAKRNLEKLLATVEEKEQLIGMLAHFDGSGALQSNNLDLTDIDEATRERIGTLQTSLRNKLVRCHETNQINGRLVQRAQQSLDEVLAILTGEHRTNTYGASGSSQGKAASRVIGRA